MCFVWCFLITPSRKLLVVFLDLNNKSIKIRHLILSLVRSMWEDRLRRGCLSLGETLLNFTAIVPWKEKISLFCISQWHLMLWSSLKYLDFTNWHWIWSSLSIIGTASSWRILQKTLLRFTQTKQYPTALYLRNYWTKITNLLKASPTQSPKRPWIIKISILFLGRRLWERDCWAGLNISDIW